MKRYTIVNAFKTSRMQPPSCKAALKKMRQYVKESKDLEDNSQANMDIDILLQLNPTTYIECKYGLQEQKERVLKGDVISSLLKGRFVRWARGTEILLAKAHLLQLENNMLQQQLRDKNKAKTRSRRSLQKGGLLSVEDAWAQIEAKDKKEKDIAIQKAKKAIQVYVNKAKAELNKRGVIARRLEKERLVHVAECEARGEEVDEELFEAIRDPEKNPTDADKELLQVPPWLQQALDEAQGPQSEDLVIDPQLIALSSNDDVEILIGRQVLNIAEPCNDHDAGDYASESEDSHHSGDSIANNADFIRFFNQLYVYLIKLFTL